jgi:hypothetical protein
LFFIQPSWIKFAGLLQTALLIYGYCTCGTFAWDQWTKFYECLVWKLPAHLFGPVKKFILFLAGKTSCTPDIRASFESLFGICSCVWGNVFLPHPTVALGTQIFSWMFGLVLLFVDRQLSVASVEDNQLQNQWGFGQLFALFMLILPFLTLLELWAGKYR